MQAYIEKQLVFENTHEAIIDADTWARVQVLRKNKRCPTHFIRAVVLEQGAHMRLMIACVSTHEERRIEELDRLFKRIYEDNANGKLSDSRFQMLSDDYEQEQEEQAENIDRFISKVRKYLDLDELTPAVLNDMVKAVYVHAPDKSNGQREQKIDISYDLVGILPASLLHNLQNGETA